MMGTNAYLDLDGCAALLGVRKQQLRGAVRSGRFAEPTGTDAGQPYWSHDTVLAWWAAQGPDQAAGVPVDLWPAATESARLLDPARWPVGKGCRDDVVLRWSAPSGVVGMLWRPDPSAYLPHRRVFEHVDAAVLVEIGGDFGIYGPTLWARNRATLDKRYEVAWPELARVLGQPLPYWPHALRDPDLIAAWRPGDPAVTAAAIPALDTAALLQMAAMFDPTHATHRTLLALAQVLQHRATDDAADDLRHVANHAQRITEYADRWPGMPDTPIHVAARPLQIDPPPCTDLDDLDPLVARIGWGELLQRSDALSWRCVGQALQWDGGQFFPFSNPEQIDPTTPAGAEWRARLEPVPDTAKPAVFAQIIAPGEDPPGFYDPLTGAPAVLDDTKILTCIPQRLPAHHPLAEIILDEGVIWVRTSDGTLYPAPQDHYYGLSWGYGGSGPGALALLIHRLLDDITAPAADDVSGAPPGLEELTQHRWPGGAVLDRALLEAAREGRPYDHPTGAEAK